MMNVEKFKLVDDGYGGIQLWGTELKKKENGMIPVEAHLKFKVPIPNEVKESIQKMKLFFLQLTGYWETRYAAYLNEHFEVKDLEDDSDGYIRAVHLFDMVKITGLTRKDGFVITGKIVNIYGQTIGLASPRITNEGSYTSYDHFAQIANECITVIEDFVNASKINMMEPKQYALNLYKDAEQHDLVEINNKTDAELIDIQRRDLEEKGYIVFNQDDLEERKEEEKESVFVGDPGEDGLAKDEKSVGMKPEPEPDNQIEEKPKEEGAKVSVGDSVKKKKEEEQEDF